MTEVKLINYDKLDRLVKDFEAMKAKYLLDIDEEKLLLDVLSDRRLNRFQDMRAKVTMAENPLIRAAQGIFKKAGVKTKDEQLD